MEEETQTKMFKPKSVMKDDIILDENFLLEKANGAKFTKNYYSEVVEIKAYTQGDKYAYATTWGAVKGNIDFGGDILTDGSMEQTIKMNRGVFPLLIDHNKALDYLAGVVYDASEEKYGLRSPIKINMELQKGRELYSQMHMMYEHGKPLGSSIGYSIIRDDYASMDGKSIHLLNEVRIHELSKTLFPMNEMAVDVDFQKACLNYYKKFHYIPTDVFSKAEPEETTPSLPSEAKSSDVEPITLDDFNSILKGLDL